MDSCLHLALLEGHDDCELAEEVRDLPADERGERYRELLAEDPEDSFEARWADDADLRAALPEGADDIIRTLDGLEDHPDLRVMYLPRSSVGDLAPLAAVDGLELLWLGVTAGADLTPLLSCERLRRVHVDGLPDADPSADEVFRQLSARGVQVDNLLPDPATSTLPFRDPILKLAVLDALRGSVTLPKIYGFDRFILDRDNLARLLAVEVSQERLDSIETLSWGSGDHTTPHLVWPEFDGESDEFTIRSLAGIEALRGLRRLDVVPFGRLPEDEVAALRARGVEVRDVLRDAARQAAAR